MKKNFLFSLSVLLTVFAGISGNTAYQSQLFPCKTYCINNNNAQKKPVGTPANLIADKSKNEESYEMVIPLLHPGDQYKEGNKISDEMPAKQSGMLTLSSVVITTNSLITL